jgi:uroporphyrin-III C-methyltransferase
MTRAALNFPEFAPGSVWLVGAGPGDPGLLTLLALHALESADVVVYDALVAPTILKLARQGAVLEHAGKRGGKPSMQQPDISLRLIALAREGKRVLRLKGGDPFVFGRGGEEAGVLAKAKIPFRIVPGITAGIGGLAYAGIPVTHRDTNSAVTFITGHDSGGKLPKLNWAGLASGSPTLVLYMARKHAGEIAAALIAAGRRADEPAAIVANAARPDQSVTVTSLDRLGEAASASPAVSIIVIGENVKLRSQLEWLAQTARELSPS